VLSFLEPSYIKEARLVIKSARKLLHYKRDLLSADSVAAFNAAIERLEQAIRDRDRAAVEAAAQELDKQWGKYLPPASEAGWRENCEVFLVAIVIAIGVRTYFLQPFTIPTGSMQPTLNGIIGTPSTEPPPNLLVQAFEFAARGRNYFNAVATADETVTGLSERKMMFFFTLTDIQCTHRTYTVWAPASTLRYSFDVFPSKQYHAGDIIARGYIDAGDHVFVDKVSYNFVGPHRGEVFVFSTRNIKRIEKDLQEEGTEGSEFYIKRLAGMPGDTLRVDSPRLYINGGEAGEFGFQRVISAVGGYRGYSNPPPFNPNFSFGAYYLTSPSQTFTVPPHQYFAMGDNSYNSSDSRFWGTVPQDNLMGRALFVYWPFLPHWGFVK
jgi:signal peptidase I